MTAKKTEIKRCAIYTRKSVEDGLEQGSTLWTRNAKLARTTSPVRNPTDGYACRSITMTAVSPVATPTGRH